MRWPNDGGKKVARVVVFFQDPGVSFGQGKGSFSVSRFKFEPWQERLADPWAWPEGYVLRLPKIFNADGGWQDPNISVEGLRFFLDRASIITRQDLIEIFRLARFPQGSGVSAKRWAEAWEQGIENLTNRLP